MVRRPRGGGNGSQSGRRLLPRFQRHAGGRKKAHAHSDDEHVGEKAVPLPKENAINDRV